MKSTAAALTALALTCTAPAVEAQFTWYVQPTDTLDTTIEDGFDALLSGPASVHTFDGLGQYETISAIGSNDGTITALDAFDPFDASDNPGVHGFSGCCYSAWPALINGKIGESFAPVMEMRFLEPVEGFGCWVFDDGSDNQFGVTVEDVHGTTTTTLLYLENWRAIEGFVGIVSTEGIVRVSIQNLALVAGTPPVPGGESFMLDGFRLKRREPTSLPTGTGEDLSLSITTPFGSSVGPLTTVDANSSNTLEIASPFGTFTGAPALLFAEILPVGTAPTPIPGLPGIDLGAGSIALIPGLLGQAPLPLEPSAAQAALPIPVGAEGLSVFLQALVISPQAINGTYAASNRIELQVL